jgi:mannose-1-phosphate guanylyltransferase/mannose-6-phosphate isomerase
LGNKRCITTVGVEDCLIVETEDAVLVAKRGNAQKVKDIVDILKKEGRKEVNEHMTVYKSWGYYTVLEEGQYFRIKKVVINPKQKINLQIHHHRSEHWVVLRGAAKAKVGNKQIYIKESESFFVPKSTLHQLENPTAAHIEIIEVQNGKILKESDTISF